MIGHEAIDVKGKVITDEVRDIIKEVKDNNGAIICGPGGGRFVYALRDEFDLFYKICPIKPMLSLADISGYKESVRINVDVMMIRPNNFGLYHGDRDYYLEDKNEIATQMEKANYSEVKRFAEKIFGEAKKRNGRITICHKKDAMPGVYRIWKKAFDEVNESNKDVDIEWVLADTFVSNSSIPHKVKEYDIVTGLNWMMDNAADIAYDGTRGTLYSANFDADGFGIYQTGHGAAHDIEGRNIANPVGQILSVAYMLKRSFGLGEISNKIIKSINKTLEDYRTADIYYNSEKKDALQLVTTKEFADYVIKNLEGDFDEKD